MFTCNLFLLFETNLNLNHGALCEDVQSQAFCIPILVFMRALILFAMALDFVLEHFTLT